MKKLVALLAVLGMVNMASAAWSLDPVNPIAGTISSIGSVAPLGTGGNIAVETYTFKLKGLGTADPKLTALDLTVTAGGNTSIVTKIGSWNYDDGDPDTAPTPVWDAWSNSVGATKIGTTATATGMLLVSNGGVYAGADPVYDNENGMWTGVDSGTYLSNKFKSVYAWQVANVKTVSTTGITLVTLVVPQGGYGTYNFQLIDANQLKTTYAGTYGVPEPATMGLLAMGALGLLRRKHA